MIIFVKKFNLLNINNRLFITHYTLLKPGRQVIHFLHFCFMRLFFFSLLVLAFGLHACKKGRAEIVLKGTLTDATFGTPLAGASVTLYETEAGGGDVNVLGTATVGNDGSYSFTFSRNPVEDYILEVRKVNYFDQDIIIPLTDLSIEEDNVRNYSTTAKSWAGLRFVTSGSGSVSYLRQQGKAGCNICCSADEQVLNGPIDTIIYCPNDGNSLYSYTYNANGQLGLKEVTTGVFDTTIVTLSF